MEKRYTWAKIRKRCNQNKISTPKTEVGKKQTSDQVLIPRKHFVVSRMSSYYPNRWPLSYLNLTKNMKTHIKQKEPPQKYRLGTISNTQLLAGLNRFYMAITSASASAVVHNIKLVLRSSW